MRRPIILALSFLLSLIVGFSIFWIWHQSTIYLTQKPIPVSVNASLELVPNKLKDDFIKFGIHEIGPCVGENSHKWSVGSRGPAVSLGIANSRVYCGILPEYPESARKKKISGTVEVFVNINEIGEVSSAHCRSKSSLLCKFAEKAAFQSKVAPIEFNNESSRMLGVLVYEFDSENGVNLKNPNSLNNSTKSPAK